MSSRSVVSSTDKKPFAANAIGRILGVPAHLAKSIIADVIWQVESPWLWRKGYQALQAAPPPLFIGGTGGSGTRVMARIAQLAGFFMGSYLNHAFDALPTITRYSNKWSKRVRPEGRTLSEVQQCQMTRDLQVAMIKHRECISHPMSLWGAKNPRFIFLLPHLRDCFPSLKFIHLIRDGRDMAFASHQYQLNQVGALYLDDLRTRLADSPVPVRSIALWSRVNLEAARFGQEILGHNYLRVRFEDLCENPSLVLQEIFEFLEITCPNLQATLAEIKPPASLGRWRSQDPGLLDLMTSEGIDGLQAFGYLKS